MTKSKRWYLGSVLTVMLGIHGRAQSGFMSEYYPALLRSEAYGTGLYNLRVYGPNDQEASINVRAELTATVFASDGTSVYGFRRRGPDGNCLLKVEFSPVRVTPILCRSSLDAVFSMTAIGAKPTKFLISGAVRTDAGMRCGIFEVDLIQSSTREIVHISTCQSGSDTLKSWYSLSASPSGKKAVAIRRDELELIDLDQGIATPIGKHFLKASWSPDGRWIAALQAKGGTALIDVNSLQTRRKLVESEVEWSPDSRYLLRIKSCSHPVASNGVGTAQALDIRTGEILTVGSSQCKIDFANVGWISHRAVPADTFRP